MASSERLSELAATIRRHRVAVGSAGIATAAAAAAVFSGCGPRNSGETSQTPQVDVPIQTETITSTPWATATIEASTVTPTPRSTPTVENTPTSVETNVSKQEVTQQNYFEFLSSDPNVSFEPKVLFDEGNHLKEVGGLNSHGVNLVIKREGESDVEITNVRDLLKAIYPIEPGDTKKVKAFLMSINNMVMSDSEIKAVVEAYANQLPALDSQMPKEPVFDGSAIRVDIWEGSEFGCFPLDQSGQIIIDPRNIQKRSVMVILPYLPGLEFPSHVDNPVGTIDGPQSIVPPDSQFTRKTPQLCSD